MKIWKNNPQVIQENVVSSYGLMSTCPWFFYGQEGEDDPESHQQLVASGYPKEETIFNTNSKVVSGSCKGW